ncbi:MAG TPA: Do family serine endopeptidase [Bryobacteraceae bacterium]|nr:Do family serine endopeptidase [Bryobacteraceae bacterium]
MRFFGKIRQQKLLSISLLLFTLSIGILIGTLMTTGVNAAKAQLAAPDATPLTIPDAVKAPNNQFVELAKRMEGSVVNISTEYTPKPSTRRRGQAAPDEEEEEGDEEGADLFRRFFGNRGPEGGSGLSPRAFRRQATGSGFIVDRNGYILTNYHVVEKADSIKVKIPNDQSEYRAKMIGYDPETDIAVIKIDAHKSLPPAKIGNSDAVQVGDWAIAIGSPFGLEATVTAGIVSATGRDVPGAEQFQRFIQTDAAINPGNSGGPLLNINGEVVGINTAIATQSGGYQGVGFALPVNTAAAVYNSIIRSGKMSRGSIGIQFTKANSRPELMKGLGLTSGVIVEKVTPGGPAEKGGMKDEDVIVAFNGKAVKDGDDLVNRVSTTPIGASATVTVDRGGKKLDLQLTIADREEQLAAADPRYSRRDDSDTPSGKNEPKSARFGISLRPANETEKQHAELGNRSAVVVTGVQEGSFADEIGLQEKDIVVSINRQPVGSADDVRALQAKLKAGDAVAFRVLRPIPGAGGRNGANNGQQYLGQYVTGTLPAE